MNTIPQVGRLPGHRPPSKPEPQTVKLIVQGDSIQDVIDFSLSEPGCGFKVTAELPLVSGVAMEVTRDGLMELARLAPESRLTLDGPVEMIKPIEEEPGIRLNTATPTVKADQMWEKGFTGQGVGVAVVDTGIAPHPDIADRIIAFKDFVNGRDEAYDDQGHGTHVAGTVAGSGAMSEGHFKGAAPEANLIGVKVLSGSGRGSLSDIIRGVQWVVQNKDRYNIKVMNLSLGGRATKGYADDPMAQAIQAASAAGIVPAVAAGNSGSRAQTINTPAHAPKALTVGADDDRRTVSISDDRVAYFSSRGPTPVDGLTKPDVIAPGVAITAADNDSSGYKTLSGTSMATPMTAGVAALLIQAHPNASPDEIKEALMSTARELSRGGDANQQGQGVIDAVAAHEFLESRQADKAA